MYLGQLVEQGRRGGLFAAPRAPVHPGAAVRGAGRRPASRQRARRRVLLGDDLPSALDPPSGCRFHTRCPVAVDRVRREVPGAAAGRRRQPSPATWSSPDGTGPDVRPDRQRWEHRMTFTTRPTLQGTFGMVSSTHWLASQSAMADARARRQRLRRGGDRRVRPARRRAAPQRARAARCRRSSPRPQRPAPAGAVRPGAGAGRARPSTHYRALGLDLVPGSGPLAAAVPGAVDAWLLLLRDHGTRSLADVLAPASATPRDGHPLLRARRRDGRPGAGAVREDWTTSAELWLPRRRPPRAGRAVHQPGARRARCSGWSTRAAAGGGREARSTPPGAPGAQGFVAEAVDAFSRRPFRDPAARRHAGAGHRRRHGRLLGHVGGAGHASTAGLTVAKTRAVGPGPGAAAAAGAARRAATTRRPLDPSTADGVHAVAEALKLAFADREAWYGDGADGAAGRRCSSPAYTKERAGAGRRRPPPASCGPAARTGASPGSRRYVPTAGRAGAARAGRTRRPASRPCAPDGRHPGRHLPRRRRRPVGQHGLGHAQRRLAAELPDHPRARASGSAAGCR